jgi:hypothetical protein
MHIQTPVLCTTQDDQTICLLFGQRHRTTKNLCVSCPGCTCFSSWDLSRRSQQCGPHHLSVITEHKRYLELYTNEQHYLYLPVTCQQSIRANVSAETVPIRYCRRRCIRHIFCHLMWMATAPRIHQSKEWIWQNTSLDVFSIIMLRSSTAPPPFRAYI